MKKEGIGLKSKKFAKAMALLLLVPTLLMSLLAGCQQPQAAVPGVTTTTTIPPTTVTTQQPSISTAPTVPTVTTQPTQPTQPTQSEEPEVPDTPPEDDGLMPDELKSNVYLNWMNTGFCEVMTGNVRLVVIFLSDAVSSWDGESIANAKAVLDGDPAKLEAEAAGYGAELDVEITYLEAKISSTYDTNDTTSAWARDALSKVGLALGFYRPQYIEN